MNTLEVALLGIGLSAACGFRVFVPLLVMGIAQQTGSIQLAPNMAWVGTTPAITVLAIATALEIGAYYVPWIDNLLDSIATPAAFVAGTLAAAAASGQLIPNSPLWQWTIAAVAGGGVAVTVQGATVVTRAASSLATGGVGNPVVSTTEAGVSTGLSILAILLPIIAGVVLVVMAVVVLWYVFHRRKQRHAPVEIPNRSDEHTDLLTNRVE